MSERLCPSCSAWECAADDAYCGYCGKPCAQLQMEVLPSVLHIGQIAPNVGFRIFNPTCGTLPIRQIRRPDWVTLLGQQPLQIAPRGTALFYGRAATFSMAAPASFLMQVDTPAGSARSVLMAIPERPVLQTTPAELMVWTDPRREGRQRIDFRFGPLAGGLRVLSVKNAGFHWMTLVDGPSVPAIASPGTLVPVSVDVDTEKIARLEHKSGEIAVEYEDAHGPKTTLLPLNFVVRHQPELRWTGENLPPPALMQTDKQRLKFVFCNRAEDDPQGGRMNAPVVLESVTLTTGGKTAGATIQVSPLPLTIAGGETGEVEFELNLESVRPGIHALKLEARTNFAELNQQSYKASIDVRELLNFDGIIAIDFGTSNTCCAVLENGSEFESVPLDGASTTDPTVVRYLDLKGKFPEIETGVRVKNQAAVDEKVASSTVQRLKQLLGEATYPLRIRPLASTDWVYREARLAARDYLHHVRVAAERQKGATFHEFILTHPAVCSIRQYRNLRFALEEAFGEHAQIHFLQEPIAALIPFFDEMAKNPAETGYTVAAFDLGGGTTDVTVVRVNHRHSGSGVQIQPEIVASWGERFGGENLTDFLVGQIQQRCQQILAAKYPSFELADHTVRGASSPDILRNEAALREWAERLKAGLSEEQSSRRELETLLLRAISRRPDEPPEYKAFEPRDLENAGAVTLQQVFVTYAKAQVARMAERLKQTIAGMPPLQYIHLSGKTTFLPVVRETLHSILPATIYRAEDPKECVVRGACLSRSMARSRVRRLVLPGESQRTTSQVGLMDDDAGRFLPVIPLDCPIPAAGLAREVPNAWNGRDVVVLWENLGVEDTRVSRDGTRNPYLQKLGTWEPQRQVEASDCWWTLGLNLTPAFALEVAAVGPDGQRVPFRPRNGGGLR